MAESKLIQVIETYDKRGKSTDEDPIRLIRQLWTVEGSLLHEDLDEYATEGSASGATEGSPCGAKPDGPKTGTEERNITLGMLRHCMREAGERGAEKFKQQLNSVHIQLTLIFDEADSTDNKDYD